MTCQVYAPLRFFVRIFGPPHGSEGRTDGSSTCSATADQPLSRAHFCVGDT